MESLKKAALLIFLIGAGSAMVPSKALAAPDALGWNDASISTAMVTGANVLISSAGSKYLVDGVVFSTTIANNSGWVEFRDTSAANASLFVGGGTGITAIMFSTSGVNNGGVSRIQYFDRPLRFYFGIAVNATGCGTLNTYCYTVLYRRVAD